MEPKPSTKPAATEEQRPEPYEPPKVTKVGNLRELLRGDGGSVLDMDPTGEPQQSSPQS